MKLVHRKISKLNHLRWFCRALAAAVAVVSVWANYLHASSMDHMGQVISILPPLLVVAAFEIGSRIPIDKDRPWYRKLPRPLATVGIAFIGAYLSYFHQRDAFFQHTNGDISTAAALPISIDGLMIVAVVSLYELNIKIGELNSFLESEAIKTARREASATELPVRPSKPGTSKREMVARLLNQSPELSVEQIAKATGASTGYVYNLVSELNKANKAELVSVE